MKQALIFIDNAVLRPIMRRAAFARKQGYTCYLIYAPLKESEQTAIADMEKDLGMNLFERIEMTTSFALPHLRTLVQSIASEADVKGLSGMLGFFTVDGLIGAHIATLAQELGVPTQNADALYRANNKYLMRDALRHAGVPTVDFGMAYDEQTAVEHARRIGFPVILKPVTGAASHLILKCDDEQQVIERFRMALEKLPTSANASIYEGAHSYPDRAGVEQHFEPVKGMLVEGYLTGREASVEMIITEQEAVPLLVHDKVVMTEGERVFYEHLLVVPPMRFTDEEVQQMKDYATSAVRALGLQNCLSHVELRYDDRLGPQILEINPRVGGMCVQDSLEALVGFSALQAQVEQATGTFELQASYPVKDEKYGMFTLYPPHSGVFEAVDGMDELNELPGMISARLVYPIGATIDGDDEEVFLLMCWVRGDSYEAIIDTYEQAVRLVTFHVRQVEKVSQEV